MRFEVEVQFHKDFIKVDGQTIQVGLMAPPVQGKANIELLKKLAKHFNVSSSQVRIVAGARSRIKIVEVTT